MYVLYSDKTWVFDQSERAQGPVCIIYIILSLIIWIGPVRALIGQKPMFYQSIKHTKSVFDCFSPYYLYIIKQMKKPMPCITL